MEDLVESDEERILSFYIIKENDNNKGHRQPTTLKKKLRFESTVNFNSFLSLIMNKMDLDEIQTIYFEQNGNGEFHSIETAVNYRMLIALAASVDDYEINIYINYTEKNEEESNDSHSDISSIPNAADSSKEAINRDLVFERLSMSKP